MQRFIICLMFFSLASMLSAQEFVDTLFFRDAVGNRDTIIIGYDPLATDSIDEQFGEIDITNKPYDSVFSVRTYIFGLNKKRIYLNKQIMKKNCPASMYKKFYLTIACKHFPLTISWDSTLYDDSCRSSSLITIAQSGWFDVGGYVYYSLKKQNSVTYYKTYWVLDKYDIITENIITENNDTLFLMIVGIGSYNAYNKKNDNDVSINIYPNPSNTFFSIHSKDILSTVEMFNCYGNILYEWYPNEKAFTYDISILNSGIYFLRITSLNHEVSVRKILKE